MQAFAKAVKLSAQITLKTKDQSVRKQKVKRNEI